MKTQFAHLKEILHNYSEDLLYLLYVGVPTAIVLFLIGRCMDYSKLF